MTVWQSGLGGRLAAACDGTALKIDFEQVGGCQRALVEPVAVMRMRLV